MENEKVFKISQTKLKVGHFTFAQDGISAELDVKDDITSLETANLAILFAQGSNVGFNSFDWIDFIKEKKIERHFTITEKP